MSKQDAHKKQADSARIALLHYNKEEDHSPKLVYRFVVKKQEIKNNPRRRAVC